LFGAPAQYFFDQIDKHFLPDLPHELSF